MDHFESNVTCLSLQMQVSNSVKSHLAKAAHDSQRGEHRDVSIDGCVEIMMTAL